MEVNRETFIETLTRVKPALGKGASVLALSHVFFDKKSLYTFDGGFGIKLDVETELECGVPGTTLLGLLNTSVLEKAKLEQRSNVLQVGLGKSVSKLAALPFEDRVWRYPAKLPCGAKSVKLDEIFMEGLRKVLFVKASPPTRVEHYGVTVQKVKNDLVLYTTDSATMASVRIPNVGKDAAFDKVLLPREFSEQLLSQSPSGATLYVLADCLIAQTADATFYSNLLDLSASDDMGAIMSRKKAEHTAMEPLPAGFDGALARAEVLSGREEAVVTLAASGKTLTVSGDYTLGALKEELALEAAVDTASIRVDAVVLRRALTYAESFSIKPTSLMLSSDEANFTYLVAALDNSR